VYHPLDAQGHPVLTPEEAAAATDSLTEHGRHARAVAAEDARHKAVLDEENTRHEAAVAAEKAAS
jgi:hypothetical protein